MILRAVDKKITKGVRLQNELDRNNCCNLMFMGEAGDEIIIDTPKLAKYLGVSRSTIEHWRINGDGPKFFKIGNLAKYRVSDVYDWTAKQQGFTSTSDATVKKAKKSDSSS